MSHKKSTPPEKKRNWSAILYPDSLPSDWKDILSSTGLLIAVSPLHDKDYEADASEPKKAHYHIIFCYNGPTSYNVVKNLVDKLNGANPQAVESVKGYYRYFTHQDNPEKYQYNPEDIQCFNGFSILDFADYTKSEVLKTKRELTFLIIENCFTEYAEFINYVLLNGTDLQFDVASGQTIYFSHYLKSIKFGTYPTDAK